MWIGKFVGITNIRYLREVTDFLERFAISFSAIRKRGDYAEREKSIKKLVLIINPL